MNQRITRRAAQGVPELDPLSIKVHLQPLLSQKKSKKSMVYTYYSLFNPCTHCNHPSFHIMRFVKGVYYKACDCNLMFKL